MEHYIEPALAWRTWVVNEHEGVPRLHSVVKGPSTTTTNLLRVPWSYRQPIKAVCYAETAKGAHESGAPGDECTCGLYGTASLIEAWEWLSWNVRHDAAKAWRTAVGLTYLWGDVLEYSAGYKAQFSYPKEIWLPPNPWRTDNSKRGEWCDRLADAYGIPVSPVETWRDVPDWDRFYGRNHLALPDTVKNAG